MSNRNSLGAPLTSALHLSVVHYLILLLVGTSLWLAHFGKAIQKSTESPYPPMHPILEILMAHGRVLSLFGMCCAILLHFICISGLKLRYMHGGALWLFILNTYLVSKLLFYDNTAFVLQSVAVIIISFLCLCPVMAQVEQYSAKITRYSVSALAAWFAGLLLVTTNLLALFIYPDSAWNEVSRFHGTTVNPQHLAMMCALVAPAFTYVIMEFRLYSLLGMTSAALICGVFVIEYATGSRMGTATVLVGLVFSFKDYLFGRKVLYGVTCGGALAIVGLLIFGDNLADLANERYLLGREDTRTVTWTRAWDVFLENPLFGAEPAIETGRLIFVENVLIAAASAGGLVALVVSAIIFISIAASVTRLMQRPVALNGNNIAFYVSALISIVSVSMFEAALLGIFTMPTMLSYLYLASSTSALDFSKFFGRRRNTMKSYPVYLYKNGLS